MTLIEYATKVLGGAFPTNKIEAGDMNEIKSAVNNNSNDSELHLDAKFTGNTTPQTIGTDWVDITQEFTINSANNFSYDADTNSFVYDGVRAYLVRGEITYYAESAGNNQDIEFGLFIDTGAGFELVANTAFPYSFRLADSTQALIISFRETMTADEKFKMRVRKPSGSSDFTFLSGKAMV